MEGRTFFGPPQHVESELARRFSALTAENNLRGLDAGRFAERAAEHVAELNAIHPFREGNGRTTRLFLETLARQAGHELHQSRISKGPWIKASIAGMNMDYRPMAEVIRGAIVGPAREQERPREAPAKGSPAPPSPAQPAAADDKAQRYEQLPRAGEDSRAAERRTSAAVRGHLRDPRGTPPQRAC